MNKDLYELSVEITGVSMIIVGLSNQLDNETTDTLTPNAMNDALFGISRYLDRIADDLTKLNNAYVLKARVAV